jgi:hypothetical protein
MLLAKSPTAQARREEGNGHGSRLARRGFRPTDLWYLAPGKPIIAPPLTSHLSTSHLSPLTSHLSPLTSHLSPLHLSPLTSPPLTSHPSPLTSHLSPLHLSPLTSHLSPLTSHLSPLTSHLSPLTAPKPSGVIHRRLSLAVQPSRGYRSG